MTNTKIRSTLDEFVHQMAIQRVERINDALENAIRTLKGMPPSVKEMVAAGWYLVEEEDGSVYLNNANETHLLVTAPEFKVRH